MLQPRVLRRPDQRPEQRQLADAQALRRPAAGAHYDWSSAMRCAISEPYCSMETSLMEEKY